MKLSKRQGPWDMGRRILQNFTRRSLKLDRCDPRIFNLLWCNLLLICGFETLFCGPFSPRLWSGHQAQSTSSGVARGACASAHGRVVHNLLRGPCLAQARLYRLIRSRGAQMTSRPLVGARFRSVHLFRPMGAWGFGLCIPRIVDGVDGRSEEALWSAGARRPIYFKVFGCLCPGK